MSPLKTLFALLLLTVSAGTFAQLGFCPGSKGDPLFTENFGNGTTYGPALPAGITTYPFVTGAPNDGQYTLFYNSNLYSTWHYSLDHTPDATNGPNGKMLLMNANAATSGDFYKKTVTGLCVNTTFEFSAWLMNVYNPNTNYCGAGQIPINVRFEIWNAAETVLLGSGNTGNIMGSSAPTWQQFALVFTTVSETSVVLKMKNNGLGGCGNDLAIDDISFSACGDLTTVASPSVSGNTYTTCTNPASIQLNATTVSPVSYYYQWQTSSDGTSWTDIAGATGATYTTPNLNTVTYFRVKAAQDLANVSNNFCSAVSNVFTVNVLAGPNPALSNGDQVICAGDPIPALSVAPQPGTGVNWYNAATGGTLLQANSLSYTPATAGTYFAETYNTITNCIGSPRTPVKLTVVALPDVTMTATASVCGGNAATVSFNGTPNAIVTYTVDGGVHQTITLNGSGLGSLTTPALAANSTYALVSVTSSDLSTCARIKNNTVTIVVNGLATASATGNAQVCSGSAASVNFSGTPNATVTYTVNSGSHQTINLDATGAAAIALPSVTATTVYALIGVSLAGGCSQALSQTVTVSVVPLPSASVSATPSSVCAGQTSTIHFSGTPNAVLTYKVDGGANQSISLDGSGSASLTTPALAANSTYTLVSATSPVLGTCTASINNAVTVTVNATATASLSATAQVCSGSAATVNFSGTPNAVVTYTVNGGAHQTMTLDAAGVASAVIPSVTTTTTYTLVDVTLTGVCPQTLSQSVSISAVALPTASISAAPAILCAGQTSTILFNGTPNAILTYQVNGGTNQTIVLGASGQAGIVTPALTANSTYTLVSAASAVLHTCSTSINNSVTVMVNPLPTASITSNAPVCYGASATVTFSGTPNAMITYTVGTGPNQTLILDASGMASIVVANVTSAVNYTLNAVTSPGTSGCTRMLSQAVSISATPLLTASISADPPVLCAGQTSTIHFSGTPGAVVSYTLGATNQTITLNAAGTAALTTPALTADTTYQLTGVMLPGTGCSRAVSNLVTLTVHAVPNALYSGNVHYCEGESVVLDLSSSLAGTTFSWTATSNGTTGAMSGAGNQIAQNVTLLNGTAGTVTYVVTPFSNGCTGTPLTIVVTIHALPVPQITDGVICVKSSAPASSQFYTLDTNLDPAGHSFEWFFDGDPIPGAVSSTYDANQIGTYTVVATNAAGCVSAPVSANVGQMATGERLVLEQSEAFSDDPMIAVAVVGGGGPFLYQLDHGAFQALNVFAPVAAGAHTIHVIDGYCTDLTAEVVVINYPKFFTPNGDGYNDTWNITGVGKAIVTIFDRYGKLVKQISSDGLGWDGMYNGRPLPSTDYWFVIDYAENGFKRTFKAHFALKR